MSDYTKSTNFASKDALPSGNALKIVKGSEIDAEFNSIAIAVASKANQTAVDLKLPTATFTTSFPNVGGAVTPTHTELNFVGGVTSAIQTQLDSLLAKMPGIGQTWQNVTASRAINTLYTNSTAKPITVAVSVFGAVPSSTLAIGFTVAGVSNINTTSTIASTTPSNLTLAAQVMVPPGATYRCDVTQGTLSNWTELR